LGDYEKFLEETWSALLSRDKGEVLRVFRALDVESRKIVVQHLTKMSTQEGWHPEQVRSAQIALSALAAILNEDAT
jgi:hypothetical protein